MAKKFCNEDRKKLEEALNNNKKISRIAEELNYSTVTIYNEIKRGKAKDNKYSAAVAQYKAVQAKANQGRVEQYKKNEDIMQDISKMLTEGFSPHQVAEKIKEKYGVNISPGTIYNYKTKGLLAGIVGKEELNQEIPTQELDTETRLFLSRVEKNKEYLQQGIHEKTYGVYNILKKYSKEIAKDMCQYLECDYTSKEIEQILEFNLTTEGKKKEDTLIAFGVCDAIQIFKDTLNDISTLNAGHIAQSCYNYTKDKSLNYISYRTNLLKEKTIPLQIGGEMKRLQKWLENDYSKYPTMVSAAAVYEHIIHVCPYSDKNITKMYAYILMNQILISEKYLPVSLEEINKHKKHEKSFLEHIAEIEIYKMIRWNDTE